MQSLRRRKVITSAFLSLLAIAATPAGAAPLLSVTLNGGGPTSSSNTLSPGSHSPLSLDVRLNSDGNLISGLFYHLEVTGPAPTPNPAAGVTYGTIPLVAVGPFTSADTAPAAGAAVDADALTSFFKSGTGDFAATDGSGVLATYQLDVSAMTPGVYSIQAIGDGLSNSSGVRIEVFATPVPFTLNISALPEPTLVVPIVCATLALIRRGRAATRR